MTDQNHQRVANKAAEITKTAQGLDVREWLAAVEMATTSVITQLYARPQRQQVLEVMHRHMLSMIKDTVLRTN